MFLSLWHYLKGYVIVEVYGGNIEKLLNLMTFHGLSIWKIHHYGQGIQFCMLASDFKQIKGELRKAKCRIKILKKRGLPFTTNKYRKRRMFLIGMALFIVLIGVLTSFVWLIDIEGNERLNGMELIHTLEEHGYETGKLKSKMDLRQAEALLVKSYPEILWVGIHYEGTKMVVRISESVIPPEIMPTEDTPTAICAKRDALITAITVEKGKPMVKVGDIVEKGELLVNGEMPLGEEQPTLYYTSAKAAIRGKTIYVAKDEITLLQKRRSYTQQTSKRYRLNFFDKKITLYAQKNLQGEYDTQYTRHQLYVTKLFPLPFGVETETQFGYLPVYKTLTEEEAKDELLSCLWKKVKGQLSRDAIVLKREATFRSSEGKMIGILYITAEENIGYEVGIQQQMLNKGEVTNEQN